MLLTGGDGIFSICIRNYYLKYIYFLSQALNYLTNNKNATFDYENVYENEGLIDELDNEMFSMRLSHEQMYDENKKSSDSISLLRLDSNKLSQQTVHDSATDMFDYDKSESTCFPLLAESTEEDDHLSYEMFGFGANKKVCNTIRSTFSLEYLHRYLTTTLVVRIQI